MHRPEGFHPISVLLCGNVKLLLDTRSMVLRHAGFQTVAVTTAREAVAALNKYNLGLMVLCHSLPHSERDALLQLMKKRAPEVRTVVLIAGGLHNIQDFVPDEVVSTFDGPAKLLGTVRHLLGVTAPLSHEVQ